MRNHVSSFPRHRVLPLLLLAAAATTSCSPARDLGPGAFPHGVVVCADTLAASVGRDVLAAGGNAVDAAVATGFALAVTYPTAGNIGGGGFMVIRFADGRTTALDFRERAPAATSPTMFTDERGAYSSRLHHNSHRSVGVPGTVAGLALAHERYGSLEWAKLVAPAERLAREGFMLTPGLARSLAGALRSMEDHPASRAKFSRNGEPYQAGETWHQPDLAATLERIRRQGRDGFYLGETARLLAEEMRRGGGLITEQDLADYRAEERTPVHGTYRGVEVVGMCPPSSGGTALIEMLNILEGFDLIAMGHNSPSYLHYLTEAMRRAFLDRARFLADPAFADVPVERLTSKEYAAGLQASIDPGKATPSEVADIELPAESPETTHISIVDAAGNAVSMTYTLEAGYGSKITVPGAGFLLNNEMGDFNGQPGLTTERGLIGSEPNLARPGQRMLSSMSPVILVRDGRLLAVVGSPGGRTIINTVLQVVLNIIDFDMDIHDAVAAARIHHQWFPDELRIEGDGVAPEVVAALEAMGHQVRMRGSQGHANSILIDVRSGTRIGVADPRQADGAAIGH